MGSSSSTCVFNDSGSEIEILCPVRKLKLQAIELGAKAEAGGSTKEGISGTLINSSKFTFAKDERVCFLRLPDKDFGKIKGGGRLLLTVISRRGSEGEEICINYPVPRNKALSVLRKTVKLETGHNGQSFGVHGSHSDEACLWNHLTWSFPSDGTGVGTLSTTSCRPDGAKAVLEQQAHAVVPVEILSVRLFKAVPAVTRVRISEAAVMSCLPLTSRRTGQ
ncbi:hypothetical protein MHYP_G00266040 [Metynnis hypsauchen]